MMEVMGTAASVRAVLAALRAHASRLPSCSSTCRMGLRLVYLPHDAWRSYQGSGPKSQQMLAKSVTVADVAFMWRCVPKPLTSNSL